ncbi:MAG: c-type cytochrome [Chloroflexota bacterium]|jgi:mono/diheme cytochrome c family protein
MRSVHILGISIVIGSTALGAMLAIMTFRWQESVYPTQASVAAASVGQSAVAQSQPGFHDTSEGEAIFRAKCSSCHTVGGGDLAGPDLEGVAQKRSRDWILEFIVAPDQVIARDDPIAAELIEKYSMPMPNLGISKPEAESILDYLSR